MLSISSKVYSIYILPRYAWNAIYLRIRSQWEIAPFYLKHLKKLCPHDDHSCSTCVRITKLNKRALGKIKNTNKNYQRGCPSLLKSVKQILRRWQSNLQQGGEKLNYYMLTLIFNMKFILILEVYNGLLQYKMELST